MRPVRVKVRDEMQKGYIYRADEADGARLSAEIQT